MITSNSYLTSCDNTKLIVAFVRNCRSVWVPVSIAWGVIGLRLEETTFTYGVVAANTLSKRARQPTSGGPQLWSLGEGLTTDRKKYIILQDINHSLPVPIQNFWTYESVWTIGRTPWTGDQPNARPLPAQDNTIQKNADTHPCLERDSNPLSQCSSGRKHYVP
jgi:hypothetical protein